MRLSESETKTWQSSVRQRMYGRIEKAVEHLAARQPWEGAVGAWDAAEKAFHEMVLTRSLDELAMLDAKASGDTALGLAKKLLDQLKLTMPSFAARHMDIMQELLEIQGQSGSEQAVMSYVVETLRKAGVPIKPWRADGRWTDDAGNLLIEIAGDPALEPVLLSAHADVVQQVTQAGSYVDEEGNLRARDANSALGTDNRAWLASTLTMASEIAKLGKKHGTIRIAITVREEIGHVGMDQIDPSFFLMPDGKKIKNAIFGDSQAEYMNGKEDVDGNEFNENLNPDHVIVYSADRDARIAQLRAMASAKGVAFFDGTQAGYQVDATTRYPDLAGDFGSAYYRYGVENVYNFGDGGTGAHETGERSSLGRNLRQTMTALDLVSQILGQTRSEIRGVEPFAATFPETAMAGAVAGAPEGLAAPAIKLVEAWRTQVPVDVRSALDGLADPSLYRELQGAVGKFVADGGKFDVYDGAPASEYAPRFEQRQLAYFDAGRNLIVLNRPALRTFYVPELETDPEILAKYYRENVAMALGHEFSHASPLAEKVRAELSRLAGGQQVLSDELEEALVAYPATADYARRINPRRFNRMIDNIERMYQALFAGAEPDQLRKFAQLFGIETLMSRLDSRVLVVGARAQNNLQVGSPEAGLPDTFKAVSADALAETINKLAQFVLPDNILVVVHDQDDVAKVQDQIGRSKLRGKVRVVVDNTNFEDDRMRQVAAAGLELASIIGLDQLMKDTGKLNRISLSEMLSMIPVLGMLARAIAEAAVKTSA
jgi:hypothetical protein